MTFKDVGYDARVWAPLSRRPRYRCEIPLMSRTTFSSSVRGRFAAARRSRYVQSGGRLVIHTEQFSCSGMSADSLAGLFESPWYLCEIPLMSLVTFSSSVRGRLAASGSGFTFMGLKGSPEPSPMLPVRDAFHESSISLKRSSLPSGSSAYSTYLMNMSTLYGDA